MAQESQSDWQKLIAKCEEDVAYRSQLSAALDTGTEPQVLELLDSIGVGGSGNKERSDRVKALRDARLPMRNVESLFSKSHVDFGAP